MPESPSSARRLTKLVALIVVAAAEALGPAVAKAQEVEEILSYDVHIDVQSDARLVVTEYITVRALGREIRRGIYRDFPTSFPRASGFGRIEAPFAVLDVRKGGSPEPYELLSIGGPVGRGGMRIRIGDADTLLNPGIYSYSIRYETERWVVFGEGQDVLYWNVTGNGWGFPIRSASARIRIANLASEPILEAWSGPEGSTASAADRFWDQSTAAAIFSTNGGLGPREGLTVRVSFPSGVVTPPSAEQLAEWFRLDWGGYIDGGYVILLVIAVYLLMWRRVGIDPAPGPISLRNEPPPGFSPAALGYLTARGYDTSQFAAALVSMAMKGAVRIQRSGSDWIIHKVDASVELPSEERKLFDALLMDRNVIELKQSRHATLRKGINALKGSLSGRFEREYFLNNRGWFSMGLFVSIAGFAALVVRWRFAIEPEAWFLGLWLTIWTAGVATLTHRAAQLVRHARRGGGAGALLGGGGILIFSIPFVVAEVVVIGILVRMVPSHLVFVAVSLGVTNVLFYHLLERPTLKGRGVLNHLDGFRAFLLGEADRRRAHTTEQTLELFEQFLPHAIALRLEDRWATGFGDALALPPRSTPGYRTPWYDHDHGQWDASSFASSLGSSLSSTLSASSMAPSSGGSGGGGGSSGGGGGGGGGGGW
jgi:uncharacterized membrane protein YgcG